MNPQPHRDDPAPRRPGPQPLTRRAFLGATALAGALAASPWTRAADAAEAEEARIVAALPARAPAQPARRRRLLIFDLNVNYGGHPSIRTANRAFTLMGERTGAFETVISRDPEVFRGDSLRTFDAVFFNNTVGNCFTDPALRQNLADFVYGGGGLLGVHGTTVGFTRWPGAIEDWPEFGLMIGARGANHRASDERVTVKLDEPDHPINAAFARQSFEFRDEFFRVGDPYSRRRLRVLLSIDTEKTDLQQGPAYGKLERADRDFALAWARNYGRGRTFYCTIAHNPYVFWDPRMLEFYLAAAQFVLGDLPAPTLPSALLTPALRAQERLGWRLGIEAYTFHRFTLFEAIEKTSQLGLPYMGGLSFQKIAADLPKNFEPGLSDEEIRKVRFQLDAAGVRLLTYYIQDIPDDDAGCRKIFEFGRKIGIETFMTEPKPEALPRIARFCDEYDLQVALHNHDAKASPLYWRPEGILEACQGLSPRLGACADLGYWMRAGIDPVEAVRKLGPRLITVQMHDLDARTPEGHDVPWGTGAGRTEEFLRELHRLGRRPTMFGLEYSHNFLASTPEVAKCAEFFDRLSLAVAAETRP
jgi:type 1 glutamine amidotransferase/sugar phosphate isomerase/epimerase